MLLMQKSDWLYKYLDTIILDCLFAQVVWVFMAQTWIFIRFWSTSFKVKFFH